MFTLYMQISHCSRSIRWKDYPFSIELSWHICWKSVGHICMYLFIDSILFHLPVCLSLWITALTLSLLPYSRSRMIVVQVIQFIFLLQYSLAFLSSLFIHINFRSACQYLQNNLAWDFDWEYNESTNQFWKIRYLNNINFSSL